MTFERGFVNVGGFGVVFGVVGVGFAGYGSIWFGGILIRVGIGRVRSYFSRVSLVFGKMWNESYY